MAFPEKYPVAVPDLPPEAPVRGVEKLCFADFELRLDSGELSRKGEPVKLQPQPAKVLELLARRSGEVVSREEIQSYVWGRNHFVDFEQGLNYCIKQIRRALEESAGEPRFLETVPRRGYRFLAPVEIAEEPLAVQPAREEAPAAVGGETAVPRRSLHRWLPTAVVLVAVGAAGLAWLGRGRPVAAPEVAQPTPAVPRLVVLPFENLSSLAEGEYLADGLTEEVISQLARRHGRRLGVIARTSSMAYKGRAESVTDIAEELRVDYLLEGSLQDAGGRARVSVQLIRGSDATHLWAETFEEGMTDLRLTRWRQDIAIEVARQLGLEILDDSEGAPLAPEEIPRSAYEAYLEGLYFLHQRGEAQRALAAFTRARQEAPSFAPAYEGWARARNRVSSQEGFGDESSIDEALLRALELDPELASARVVLAERLFFGSYDIPAAEREIRRALDLNPSSAEAHHAYAGIVSALGHHEEAVAEMKRALELDPISMLVTTDVGWYSYYAGHYREAIEAGRRALTLAPAMIWGHRVILLSALEMGEEETAVAQARDEAKALAERELAPAPEGEIESMADYWRWRRALLAFQEERGWFVSPSDRAEVALGVGDYEAALDLLEESCRTKVGWLNVFLDADPRLVPLRGEPRFERLRSCVIGLPAEPSPRPAGQGG